MKRLSVVCTAKYGYGANGCDRWSLALLTQYGIINGKPKTDMSPPRPWGAAGTKTGRVQGNQ
jgi:hypothetical protein